MKIMIMTFGVIALLVLGLTSYSTLFASPVPVERAQPLASVYAEGKFLNAHPIKEMDFSEGVQNMWKFFTDKSPESSPDQPVAVQPLRTEDLQNAPDLAIWRLGHSSVLMKVSGKFWLTDPVFAQRASPFGFIGPKRFHAAPIQREDLPEIEAVLISHDHYDHLDQETVLAIAPKVHHFLTPLGVGNRLIDWGIPAEKVRQFDWWEAMQIGTVKLVATPAQHFSGRSLTDRNRTLWSSWVLMAPAARIFFSGDTGYFDGFKQIGERFGPFDLTLLENGAYNQAWADIHMHPEQTVQAHIDLRGKQLVPIHNGTFDLAMHAWTEPFERTTRIAAERGVALNWPRIGERFDIKHPGQSVAWWRPAEKPQQFGAARKPLVAQGIK